MMSRTEITALIDRLCQSQAALSHQVMTSIRHEDLDVGTEDGYTVLDALQMWVHELRSHHRELILARGRLTGDNPHFHVPHFVRQANEAFGQLIGELAALSDKDLVRRLPDDGRTVHEIAEHVIGTLEGYFPGQIAGAIDGEKSKQPGEQRTE
jgi:hypothetical protein